MIFEDHRSSEPYFIISIAARMVGLHTQTLRYYERAGLVHPSRSMGRQRLYSLIDIERVRRIKALTDEMGLNLAGVEVALRLIERMGEMQREIEQLTEEVKRLRVASSQSQTIQE